MSTRDFSRGVDIALAIINERLRAYAARRQLTGNPVGIIETELLYVKEKIRAREKREESVVLTELEAR